MAGHSGTPLPRKLGIKDDSRVRLVGEPDGFARALGVVPRRRGDADVIVLFARDARELSVCAIDDTWSSLRFVVRVADRS